MESNIKQLNSLYANSPGINDADHITFSKNRPAQSSPAVPTPDHSYLATVVMWFLILGTLASGLVLTVQMGLAAIANNQAAKDLEIKEAQLAQVREARTICGTFPGIN